MKRKMILLLLAFGICGANAQTVTIINETPHCNLMIYSGEIKVYGVDYLWGSEKPEQSMSYAKDTVVFTTDPTAPLLPPNPPVPPYYIQKVFTGIPPSPIPYVANPPTANQYIGFKFRLVDGTGVGYISAANPYTISTPASCLNMMSYTVVWTGTSDNPTVYILP